MAVERQETGVDAWFRAFANRDFAALAAMYHPDACYERPDGRAAGVGEIIAYLRALVAAAPNATAAVEAAHFASQAVTVEWTETYADGEQDRVVDVFRVVNGRIVSQRQYLDPARRLRLLAAYAARPPEPEPEQPRDLAQTMIGTAAPKSDAPSGPAFRIESGSDTGIVFPIADGTFTIGRARDNWLVLRDPTTSSHHAEVESRPGELVLADLESTNGTFVNGERIRRRQLADGDRIGIGQNGLVFFAAGAAAKG